MLFVPCINIVTNYDECRDELIYERLCFQFWDINLVNFIVVQAEDNIIC